MTPIIRVLIAVLAVMITVWSQWPPGGARFPADEALRDRILQARQITLPEPRVLVVDIDEASMAELGPWPWPRSRLADLVDILLTRYAAKGVALDILLPTPADADGDMRLRLLAEHGPVVLAQAFDYVEARPLALREGTLAGAVGRHGDGGLPATGYIANHAGLNGARHVGNIGFLQDPDGALRRVPLLTRYQGASYPALGLALLDCCGGGAAADNASFGFGGDAVMRVDFSRDWKAYTVVGAADILAERIVPASAEGRLVLIGSSSLGLGDRVTTPLARNRPGLGVQAAVLSTLLDRRQGTAPAPWPGRLLACAFTAALTLLALWSFPRLSAIASVGLLALGSLAWLAAAWWLLPHDDQMASTGPLAANLFLLAVAVPYQWQLSQRRSRHLLDTLRQYVAPAVVEELMRRDDITDPLKPRRCDVTTLIADLEGYTSHVEALTVEDAAELTRSFLDCLTLPVIAQHGTLDKYTGDGLVAFWGAPLPNPDHADLALDAALDIVRRVRAFSERRAAFGLPPLRVRIGIDSGVAMAGDFGTAFRSIYTAVGDSVNTASRLEHAAREFPFDVIVGEGTQARTRRHALVALGQRLLRGKGKPTTLYTFSSSMEATSSSNTTHTGAAAGTASA
jgi:adenylate cyclase